MSQAKQKKVSSSMQHVQNAQILIHPMHAQSHPGICSPFMYPIMDAQADLSLPCQHMSEDTFLHGEACITICQLYTLIKSKPSHVFLLAFSRMTWTLTKQNSLMRTHSFIFTMRLNKKMTQFISALSVQTAKMAYKICNNSLCPS